ncbi:MAG TPA: serine/threonine-protein kinase [Thermoanaerobaculia bacterium]|nr:serine/threonine-protein kinase [Thermoanaerobaculia bacterium]
MSQINCLRCKSPIDAQADQCPHCGERVTLFQRTYSTRLLDGKYQIIDRLGVGGMGEIFKVRHIHLNELRVIKIMRPNVATDDQGLQRFLQEARTSTMIKHKNLAMLYDFAQLEDGSYYMVWEFIDGTNIQKWIAQNGPIPPRLTVEISIQALAGLDHLHSMGLIHRDISPENIMLSQDHHGKLAVKVIDFGIAKQLAEGEGGQGLTQTGMFLGKLKYASPEQAGFLKDNEHLDPRSDLYSFGIVMYEMLAGRAPFQATNPHGYILKHVTEKPAPVIEVNPSVKVPAQLEAVMMKSLEKNRDARHATAADFAHELEAIRNTIAPDQKYGLGERMVTLSGAQTLADLKMSGSTAPSPTLGGAQATQQTYAGSQATQQTYAGGTMPGAQAKTMTGAAGTRTGSDDATVMERDLVSRTMPGAAQKKTIGSDEATIMERLDSPSAAPTMVEAKLRPGDMAEAEATVMERLQPPASAPKKNGAVIGAIAAVVVIALALAGYFMVHKKEPQAVATTTAAPSGTEVTTTGAPSVAPVPAGQGLLLLSASPWGDLEKIVSANDQHEIALTAEERSTPARIPLDPGKYIVTLSGPVGTKTIDVQIETGKRTPHNIDMGSVDYDALADEVSKP